VLYVKGAPEIVLANCNHVETAAGFATVEESRSDIEKKLLEYQNMAMRTLGFAYQLLGPDDDASRFVNGALSGTDLVFVGLVAISDPVRDDVAEAVQQCRNAGIDVKIVTGDTSGTAREIARQIGIYNDAVDADSVITGLDFEALADDEAAKRAMGLKIMCRARPMDKQRLVRLLQEQDAVVAVTGDGTNDAPALKAAQVGLSMGDGTSVAKEASDITIIDNSFTSIARAVMWGRSLYRNIQRFLLFQLTINVAACVVVMIGSLIGTDSPLTITQMLWVNLIMDTFAAGALASLPPNPKVMEDHPRKSGAKGDFIITAPMAWNIFLTGALFVVLQVVLLLWLGEGGELSAYGQTEFFTFFVMLQFWNMFNAKAYMSGASAFKGLGTNHAFIFVCAAILVGQYLIVTFGGEMFNVVPLTVRSWGVIIASTSLVLWVGEAVRLFSKK
jgi:Ca2+-transporting ATPase